MASSVSSYLTLLRFPRISTRLRSLDEAASDVNLPSSARDVWRNILSERALEDDEVDEFHSEFRDTPIQKARSIRGEIRKRDRVAYPLWFRLHADILKDLWAHMTGARPFAIMPPVVAERFLSNYLRGDPMMVSCLASSCRRILR